MSFLKKFLGIQVQETPTNINPIEAVVLFLTAIKTWGPALLFNSRVKDAILDLLRSCNDRENRQFIADVIRESKKLCELPEEPEES